MARMGRPPAHTQQVSVRIPEAWVERAEAIAAALRRSGASGTTASVYRAALERGLEELEVQHGITKRRRA